MGIPLDNGQGSFVNPSVIVDNVERFVTPPIGEGKGIEALHPPQQGTDVMQVGWIGTGGGR